MKPKISIISGIYNCAETIEPAIESVLAQTISEWEWILCDDGSSDDTFFVVKKYAAKYPDKFILIKNEENKGLNFTLNRCLKYAKGKYIARMDGDDICMPERFEEELKVLDSNPAVAIVSTDMAFFDETGVWGRISHPEYPQSIDFMRGTPFCHAPCMVRKEAYEAVGGYSVENNLLRVEDYHLWVKMYRKGFRGKNINKPLYHMRDDRNAYQRRKFRYRINEAHVHLYAMKELNLPKIGYLYACKPIIVGLLPEFLYKIMHKMRLNRRDRNDS